MAEVLNPQVAAALQLGTQQESPNAKKLAKILKEGGTAAQNTVIEAGKVAAAAAANASYGETKKFVFTKDQLAVLCGDNAKCDALLTEASKWAESAVSKGGIVTEGFGNKVTITPVVNGVFDLSHSQEMAINAGSLVGKGGKAVDWYKKAGASLLEGNPVAISVKVTPAGMPHSIGEGPIWVSAEDETTFKERPVGPVESDAVQTWNEAKAGARMAAKSIGMYNALGAGIQGFTTMSIVERMEVLTALSAAAE